MLVPSAQSHMLTYAPSPRRVWRACRGRSSNAWMAWPSGGIEDDGQWEQAEALSSTDMATPMHTPGVSRGAPGSETPGAWLPGGRDSDRGRGSNGAGAGAGAGSEAGAGAGAGGDERDHSSAAASAWDDAFKAEEDEGMGAGDEEADRAAYEKAQEDFDRAFYLSDGGVSAPERSRVLLVAWQPAPGWTGLYSCL